MREHAEELKEMILSLEEERLALRDLPAGASLALWVGEAIAELERLLALLDVEPAALDRVAFRAQVDTVTAKAREGQEQARRFLRESEAAPPLEAA